MKQYWDAKTTHYDKLVAINMWDFYWFFFDDAYKTSPILGLRIGKFGDGKFHTNFAAKKMKEYAPILLDHGY